MRLRPIGLLSALAMLLLIESACASQPIAVPPAVPAPSPAPPAAGV
ncbi:MAG TPA: hypothetical protein VGN11_11965 [Candidatus Baltobacteraceae bacterium]|nr:hypothetical protein [Candidatus Baltobacteraceae bacterium]